MTDTPPHIYDLQTKIWLSKTPAERLHQFMINNEALLKFFREIKSARTSSKKEIVTKRLDTGEIF